MHILGPSQSYVNIDGAVRERCVRDQPPVTFSQVTAMCPHHCMAFSDLEERIWGEGEEYHKDVG